MKKICFDRRNLLLFVLMLLLDAGSKFAARHLRGELPLIKGVLSLRLCENTGAAFSVLEGHPAAALLLSGAVLVGLCLYLCLAQTRGAERTALHMVLAGGCGNFLERLLRGAVTDFLSPEFIRFPVFNLADVYVTCGVGLLILLLFRRDAQIRK